MKKDISHKGATIHNKSPYTISFSIGGLLHREISAVLPLFCSEQANELIREEIKQNNVLQINSEAARKRIVGEIRKRITTKDTRFWQLFSQSSEEDQKILLFYVCLTTYKLVFDFHFEVTLSIWNSSSSVVDAYLYKMELDEIGGNDQFVFDLSDVSKKKAISSYLRMLKELKLLDTTSNQLKSVTPSAEILNYMVKNREFWFLDACLLSAQTKTQLITTAL